MPKSICDTGGHYHILEPAASFDAEVLRNSPAGSLACYPHFFDCPGDDKEAKGPENNWACGTLALEPCAFNFDRPLCLAKENNNDERNACEPMITAACSLSTSPKYWNALGSVEL
jgi:hypothetical protein